MTNYAIFIPESGKPNLVKAVESACWGWKHEWLDATYLMSGEPPASMRQRLESIQIGDTLIVASAKKGKSLPRSYDPGREVVLETYISCTVTRELYTETDSVWEPAPDSYSERIDFDITHLQGDVPGNPLGDELLQALTLSNLRSSTPIPIGLKPPIPAGMESKADTSEEAVGSQYIRARPKPITGSSEPFSVDPDAVDRGLKAHADIQNRLADIAALLGAEPRSPKSTEPTYDLAFRWDGTTFVAEAKSTTAANEDKQLRLGLGQILHYRQLLPGSVGILAIESRPADLDVWQQLCDKTNLVLWWPGRDLKSLLEDARANR